MKVVIVSQCTKNALIESRRILDQFAERFGETVWQTHITEQGLETLRKILKKTARRNTAIACHWIRGRSFDELLWIVGDASRFNDEGCVPTNITAKDVLRQGDEDNWHTGHDIQILAAIAALFHDFGKSNSTFQKLLRKESKGKTNQAYRHEWVSLRLFQSFVGEHSDEEWLKKLSIVDFNFSEVLIKGLNKDGITENFTSPFQLPPIAKAIAWLILSHHRMPTKDVVKPIFLNDLLRNISPSWNHNPKNIEDKDIKGCWEFKHGLPFASQSWCVRARYWAETALKRKQLFEVNWIQEDIFSIHLARLCLMLGDHYYSSQDQHVDLGDLGFPLYANTNKERKLKQRLDEHLLGVEKCTAQIAKDLPLLSLSLSRIARHKGFTQRSKNAMFRWQDDAYELACSIRNQTIHQGFFGVNLASTGCGKTFANGRIMYGLAEPKQGARFTIALGLRTLTLQTGEAYRQRLKLNSDDLAVLIGSSAVGELFNLNNKMKDQSENIDGSESIEDFLGAHEHVVFEGAKISGRFGRWLGNNSDAKKLLSAPILTCTIDHLIGATESTRGGKQILPMLRLMTSDLVLDEPDDFDMSDLSSLTRLVHWAGLLGSRVLLSSATLPPALIGGLFEAYKSGRESFQKCRGIPGRNLGVYCAWFDEYGTKSSQHFSSEDYLKEHQNFINKRVKNIEKKNTLRKAEIRSLNITSNDKKEIISEFATSINLMLHELHKNNHVIDPKTGKRLSFGLIRMAHIDRLIDIAEVIFKEGAQENHQIRLCCYHSRHPLLVRSNLEFKLDEILNRHDQQKIFDYQEIRNEIESNSESNIIFVVLATPVAEVGRDHDYDWGIVEPSSMRSIIQLAGRIRRHRSHHALIPNIYLLETNLKSLIQPGTISYCQPGFEKDTEKFRLKSHHLKEILKERQFQSINSIPRIIQPNELKPNENLVDLEHGRLNTLMLSDDISEEWPVNLWWKTNAHLSGVLQLKSPFRKNLEKNQKFYLLPDEDEKEINFYSYTEGVPKPQDKIFERYEIKLGERIKPWGNSDYMTELIANAEKQQLDLQIYAKKFGWVELPEEDNQLHWLYNHTMGFRRSK